MKNALIVRRESKTEKRFLLRQNRSVYLYNDAMKDSLAVLNSGVMRKSFKHLNVTFLPALKRHIHQIHILSSLFR